MRIIQSIWTGNNLDFLNNNFGWLAPEYNLMSWALSCLQLKKHYPDVILYCDKTSKNILIDVLKLPYSETVCNLDDLNSYHSDLWALSKIYAYSQQEKPFLHIDGDVFIWKKFDNNLLISKLIAQNEDEISSFKATMQSLESKFYYFPNEILKIRENNNPVRTFNAGIFGGTDIAFFKEYTAKSFEFVNKNLEYFEKIKLSDFNVIFEQYLFYCIAKHKDQKVNLLFPKLIKDNQYKGLGDFDKIPYEKTFIHLLSDYKKSELICKQLADKLRNEYPVYYYRIIELYRSSNIQLFKNYYSEFPQNENLLSNYYKIKEAFLESKIEKLNVGNKRQYNLIIIDSIIDKNKDIILNSEQLKDLNTLCENINQIIKDTFSFISFDYLYCRDIHIDQYFEYLFAEPDLVYEKRLIAESISEIIETKYDWSSFFERNDVKSLNINPCPSIESSEIKNIIIPECDTVGFSITTLDSLDLVILEILETQKTIRALIEKLKNYFDDDDFNESILEFEKLLFLKIKRLIHIKSIRVLF